MITIKRVINKRSIELTPKIKQRRLKALTVRGVIKKILNMKVHRYFFRLLYVQPAKDMNNRQGRILAFLKKSESEVFGRTKLHKKGFRNVYFFT